MSLLTKRAFTGASIQDDGRSGLQRYGVTSSGGVDKLALAQGRALLKDEENTAVIEFSAVGGTFLVQESSFFVLTGAEAQLYLNDTPILRGQVFRAQVGDEIKIGSITKGFYSYLHVAGGFCTDSHLKSRSTNIQAGLGTTLETGKILPYKKKLNRNLMYMNLGEYCNSDSIRIVSGPQTDFFPEKVFERFLDTEFEVSQKRDRMGVKLNFKSKNFFIEDGLSIVSDAIEVGDIQIDGQGQPTVLLNDRQPTGGYPRISTVISADLHKFAQISINSKFNFVLVSLEEAIIALKELAEQLKTLNEQVDFFQRDPHDISNLLSYSLVGGAIRGDEYDES